MRTLHIPSGFDSLKYLYLKDNQLTSFTFEESLPEIDIIDLRDNQMEEFPQNFHQLTTLQNLLVGENPWSQLPRGIIPEEDDRINAVEPVMKYLKEFEKGTVVNDRVKLILVGNGRVGKTSMFKRLKGLDFNPHESITHGVQLGQLKKEHLSEEMSPSLNS